MNEKKAVFVTVLLSVLIVFAMICLYALHFRVVFFLAATAFALIGLAVGAVRFCEWLMDNGESEQLEPPHVGGETPEPPLHTEESVPEIVVSTVEDIMNEVREGSK